MTAEEIKKIIEENNLQRGLMDYENTEETAEKLESLGVVNFEEVDSVCNSDEMYTIIHFKNDNIFLKLKGEYDSYGECQHDYDCGIEEVFPKTIQQTIYTAKK